MACKGERGGRHATIGDVDKNDKITRYEQLLAWFCSEYIVEQFDRFVDRYEQFGDQFKALGLADQFSAMAIAINRIVFRGGR